MHFWPLWSRCPTTRTLCWSTRVLSVRSPYGLPGATNPGAYFAQHELRYIGEITERFEERIGSRPEIFRALALALGFALPFLTDSMFVGTQREDFIRRLDKEAGNDLYLQGARYLLTTDPMERKQLRSQLAGDTYQRTEDAMFVLSLFDPQEDEFPAMRPQIARLWGVDRTIPLLGNGRMLDWLLCNYKPVIAECRKKDNAVLRALLKLPGQFCKEDSALYKTLIDLGYSTLEIRYANSWMIWPCQNPVGLNPNGIPARRRLPNFVSLHSIRTRSCRTRLSPTWRDSTPCTVNFTSVTKGMRGYGLLSPHRSIRPTLKQYCG